MHNYIIITIIIVIKTILTIIKQTQSLFIWLAAVLRTIHVIIDGHKRPKNWKLALFPNAKEGTMRLREVK